MTLHIQIDEKVEGGPWELMYYDIARGVETTFEKHDVWDSLLAKINAMGLSISQSNENTTS